MRQRPSHPSDSQSIVKLAAAAALDRKAEDLSVYDVDALSGYADYFLLASGRSTRQTIAIAERVQRVLKKAGMTWTPCGRTRPSWSWSQRCWPGLSPRRQVNSPGFRKARQ